MLKRQRELKKAERAAEKKERRQEERPEEGSSVASQDDLAGYGFPVHDEEGEKDARD